MKQFSKSQTVTHTATIKGVSIFYGEAGDASKPTPQCLRVGLVCDRDQGCESEYHSRRLTEFDWPKDGCDTTYPICGILTKCASTCAAQCRKPHLC